MNAIAAAKAWVRGNTSLHGLAKVARDFRAFLSSGAASDLDRLHDIAKIYGRTMLPPARLMSICAVVDSINRENVSGDIVECGVWRGGALALFALRDMKHAGSKRLYIGFDSFEGLPPPTPEDDVVFDTFNQNSIKLGRSVTNRLQKTGVCVGDSADSVRQFFQQAGIPVERSQLHPGWFQDSLPKFSPTLGSLSVLRIDGDWYESTKICLDHLFDKVSPGGYVIVDDYGAFPGCKKAVDEFREAKGLNTPIIFVDDHCIWFRTET